MRPGISALFWLLDLLCSSTLLGSWLVASRGRKKLRLIGARHTVLDRQRLIIHEARPGLITGRVEINGPPLSAARSITMAQALALGHHRILGVARRREAGLVD